MDVVRSRWPSTADLAGLLCRQAQGSAELATHHRIRHAVFVAEQRLFQLDDRDVHDADAATIHVLGLDDGVPAGTVRLYPLGDGIWKGDRLAVLPEHRRSGGLGASLVRYAVATAGAWGGSRMVAQIQPGNVRFFEALGWAAVGEPADYLGVLHQPMSIALR
jgi:putative N-acetyltransferase (TIGR04045 family)